MILLIDNYDSFTHNLFQQVAALEERVCVFRNDKISLPEIELMQPRGIILSPGPGRPEQAGICIELIKAWSGRVPLFGVCLGHQALAVAFGGEVVGAEEIVHGKPAMVFHYRQQLYRRMPLPFAAGRYHSLVVRRDNLPQDFIIEAETSDGLIMGMRHRQHLSFGVQFHPESILTPQGNILMAEFVKLCQQ